MGLIERKDAKLLGACLALTSWGVGCTGVLGSGGGDDQDSTASGDETSGLSGDGDGDDSLFTADVEACADSHEPGASPIRRLSRSEYNRTLFDLTGDESSPANAFPEEGGSGFDNNADVAAVSRLLAGKYQEAAEMTASGFASDLFEQHDCATKTPECIRHVVADFGEEAYRRPLSEEEVAAKVDFFNASVSDFGEAAAERGLVESILQSPHYLYRVELSGVGVEEAEMVAPWELASRLSYFLWGTLPDETLRDAARGGDLGTPEGVRTQALRMLEDERAEPIIEHFHNQWMGIDDIERTEKDEALFPSFDAEIAALLKTETEMFVRHVVSEGGTFDELLTSQDTFLNEQLADFYGVSFNGSSNFSLWSAPAGERAGILSQGSVLAAHSKATETGVIQRGLFLREQLFCQIPPPPPDGVETELPPPAPDLSMRERVTAHRADPACSACHELLDPLGFGFEHFDPIGRYRETEDGLAIDASGELAGTDSDGPFNGVNELAAIVAESRTAHECYVTQWFRFTQGRTESENDACSLTELVGAFDDNNHSITDLLLALTQTDAFLYRKADH